MSDGQDTGASGAAQPEAPSGDTWEELGQQLNELGAAVAAAIKAAADDPENRRRAEELKEGLEAAARDIGEALSGVASSEHGQRMKEAAEAVAAASRRVAEDARPHLVNATRKVSEALRETAARIEREHTDPAGGAGTGNEGREA